MKEWWSNKWGYVCWVSDFGRIWKVDFDQPHLPIREESDAVILVSQAS
jgi:hypothetical protein